MWLALPLSSHAQVLGLSQEEIQKLQQASPDERERMAKELSKRRQSAQGGQAQKAGDSTEEDAVQPLDKGESEQQQAEQAEEEKAAESALQREVDEYRRQVSLATDRLQPFGYELFAGKPRSFQPATEIPIPAEYRIGPGDVVRLQLFGQQNELYELPVNRDGTIELPKVGPVSVAGLSFDDMREQLKRQIAKRFIGVEASITLGELRSIRIFVMGEARNPGAYTVSSLSNITNALFVSGGVKVSGSLRNVQLMRDGKVVTTLDLYDLLLRGDTSADRRLMPGDVILVPPVGKTVAVAGQVVRPAVYELGKDSTIGRVIELAGGFRSEAYPKYAKLRRIEQDFNRTVEDIDLTRPASRNIALKDGDQLTVGEISELLDGYVNLQGQARRTGNYEWREGLRFSDLVDSLRKDLSENADFEYAMIIREINLERDVTALAFSPRQAVEQPNSSADPILQDRDRILIFHRTESRSGLLEPHVLQIRSQVPLNERPALVSISGTVHAPGTYPLAAANTPARLLAAAGDITPLSVDKNYVLMVREINAEGDIAVRQFSLEELLAAGQDMQLQPGDRLLLFNREESRQSALEGVLEQLRTQVSPGQPPKTVAVSGQVRFPGTYPLPEQYTVEQLIAAVGGLLDTTYLGRAEVVRTKLQPEQADTSLLTTDIDRSGRSEQRIVLEPLDRVHVKQLPQYGERLTVTLQGEVRFPGSYPVRKGETLSSLIERAGGLTEHAYPQGAVFTREELREQEAQRLRQAEQRLRRDIATLSVEESSKFTVAGGEGEDPAEKLEGALDKIQSADAVGRLVIDLPALLAEKPGLDVVLRDGDQLRIPAITQSVTVIGEVQFPASHLYQPRLTVDDYLERSGGGSRTADMGRLYVIRADGSVWLPRRSNWFGGNGGAIQPGDTIVVPLDIDQLDKLQIVSELSQILYQISLGAAAVNSF